MNLGNNPEKDQSARRLGDAVKIAGDYQFNALHTGPGFQRAWHREKLYMLDSWHTASIGSVGLDVGFGSGVLSAFLADKDCTMSGIDSNSDAVEFARKTYAEKNCQFFLGQVDELEFDTVFDFAICFEVIEHLYAPQINVLLESTLKNLRPGGRLLLTTPNYHGTWPLIETTCDRFASLPQMDGDQHVTHFYRSRLRKFMQEAGFEDIRISTFCTFSPVLGSIIPKAHKSLSNLERKIPIPFGNLLVCDAAKPL
jgi:2-polyprenyl-3-methyl-5-hydroxy-6-metoxy-1,4-benzoquinol methylase